MCEECYGINVTFSEKQRVWLELFPSLVYYRPYHLALIVLELLKWICWSSVLEWAKMLKHGCSLLSCRPIADLISFACSCVSIRMCVCVCVCRGVEREGEREGNELGDMYVKYPVK